MKKSDHLKTVGGIALGIVGIAICVGFLFASDLEKSRRSLIFQDSHCPVENAVKVWGFYEIFPPKIPHKIAVVIDATDRIPVTQRNEIVNWFQSEFVRSLDRFTNVAIFQLHSNISDKIPEFEKCAPPSEANPWIENPRIVRKVFETKFLRELLHVVESLASGDEKEFSPILEMVEKMFESYDEIILVSDLMHHTTGYSLYRSPDNNHNYNHFLETLHAATITKNRQGKKLTTIYVIRKKLKKKQNKTLRAFWWEHLESNDGEFIVVKTLSAIGV